MKDTNEVEKQLERKADAYLLKKAEEIINIREQIERDLNVAQGFIDYITDYDKYCEADEVDKRDYVSYHGRLVTKNKLKDELAINYKERLVKKYTKELLNKLDIFE